MSAAVNWSPGAVRDMSRLPIKVAGAIATFVEERLAVNPPRLSKVLVGELEGVRSARNGDYRVLFELDQAGETLLVLRVDHRSRVYRT